MKRNPVASFVSGFIITGIVLCLIFIFLIYLTFDLGGGKTLQELEIHRTAMLAITLLIILGAGWVARDFIRNQKRFVAYGIRVMALLCLVIVTANYIYNLAIPTPFNKVKWDQSEYKPYHMAATLVKRDTLYGLTWQQVKDSLGSGTYERAFETAGDGYVEYLVEDSWTLTIYFKKDKVSEVVFRLPYLGV